MYKLAVCRPYGCTASDITAVLEQLMGNVSILPLFQDQLCQTIETYTEVTIADIITITLIAICVLLMVNSTIYDIYLNVNQLECRNQLYLAFSVLTNGKKLLATTKHSKEQIHTFNGIRVISMIWIVAGHSMYVWPSYAVSNTPDVENWQTKLYGAYISSAVLAVDTFFFISGFLLAYQYLKQKPKSLANHVKSVPAMYLYRYLRFVKILLKTALYSIEGWNPTGRFKLTMIQMLTLNIFFIAMPLGIKLIFREYDNDYDTHSRLIDYFIGITLGIFMRVRQDKPFLYLINSKRLRTINIFVWIVVICGMLAIVICLREVDLHHGYISQSIFASLMRPAWCVGLSWIVYSCYHGYGALGQPIEGVRVALELIVNIFCLGSPPVLTFIYILGIVNWILCRPIFQIWSRLTYCMYLLHLTLIMIYMNGVKIRLHFSDFEAFYLFCGHLILTFCLAIFWTLAFESPVIVIERVLLKGGRRKPESKVPANGKVENGASEA
ncbi:hypothetical protein NQ317_007558 [Molorchus minor]|uniref:Acyltransferase 3 domain-containing protein n=1 Tax=Molorchus minor TaxID=1323400 RepID=A0ABQ9K7A3_9CUCU|nr:hypothetical protein NQ317_007558 [Molorchus minor]